MFVLNVFFLVLLPNIGALDEFLRGQSVAYGIASLAENFTTSACIQNFQQFYEDVDLKRFWALKVLDASGQPRTGFLWGNNLWIGSHFQCLDIANKKPLEVNNTKIKRPAPTPYDYPPYPLQFVMVYMRHNSSHQQHTQMPLDNLIQLGLCVPQSCSANELQELVELYLERRYLKVQNVYEMDMQISEVKPVRDDPITGLPKTIVALSILALTTALLIIGTVYDVNVTQPRIRAEKEDKKNQTFVSTLESTNKKVWEASMIKEPEKPKCDGGVFGQIVQCFSFYSNIKSLVRTRINNSVECAHGMRLFSILWVISVHAVFFEIDYLENVPEGFRLSEPFIMQIFSNSTYCVDSFFFLSGFLMSYTFYKSKKDSMKNERPVNITAKIMEFLTMMTHRYLRLTPVYAITILFTDTLFTYYRQAYVLQTSEDADLNCPTYWWRNLLYINNFYPRSEMCMSWSWYLSADTQFFMVAALLLILSTIAFKTAAFLLFAIVAACMGVTGYTVYSIGYIPTMDDQRITLDAIYDFPWNRIGPYLIGVVSGYILVIKLEEKLHVKKWQLVLLWILFPIINLWILFATYGRQMSVEFSAVYMGISRTFWGFGLGWLFIACCTGNAGIVNKFLAFKGWIPLSRITYCCYLINPTLITVLLLGSETNQHSSYASFTLIIFGATLITFIVAFWYSLVFESPYLLLTKLLFKKLMGKRRQENNPV